MRKHDAVSVTIYGSKIYGLLSSSARMPRAVFLASGCGAAQNCVTAPRQIGFSRSLFYAQPGEPNFAARSFSTFCVLLRSPPPKTCRAVGAWHICRRPCETCPRRPRPAPLPPALAHQVHQNRDEAQRAVGTTHVEQIFRNDSDATLEALISSPSRSRPQSPSCDLGRATVLRRAKCVRAKRRAHLRPDRAQQRDPGRLEYPVRICFKRASFPSRRAPTKSWN